jgi:nicotinate-nucleotide adenylyltransferase
MGSVGILGGTFNPVHYGHIRHAIEVAESLGLDKVFLMPCASPPHKTHTGLLPFDLRTELLQAAVRSIPMLEVCTLEGTLEGPSYTWRLLQEWQKRFPGSLPYFMMGAESFAALNTWFRGLELPQLAHLVMVPRAGDDGGLFYDSIRRFWPGSLKADTPVPKQMDTVELNGGGQCIFLPVPRLDISSTYLRKRWCAGGHLEGLMPEGALEVLNAHRADVFACWQPLVLEQLL